MFIYFRLFSSRTSYLWKGKRRGSRSFLMRKHRRKSYYQRLSRGKSLRLCQWCLPKASTLMGFILQYSWRVLGHLIHLNQASLIHHKMRKTIWVRASYIFLHASSLKSKTSIPPTRLQVPVILGSLLMIMPFGLGLTEFLYWWSLLFKSVFVVAIINKQ